MHQDTKMFGPADYKNVRKPLSEAATLPAHCYTDKDFFQREVERIFSTGWEFVGRTDELESQGDMILADSVRGASIVVRGADNELRAFANSCRHRGMRLKNDRGNCRKFICPYHAWHYDLNGRLKAAPGMQDVENFSLEDFSLESRRLEIWGGFIFINYHREAPSLIDSIGDLPRFTNQYRLDELNCVRRIEFDVHCNWKLIIENALEAYHTGIVHRNTLGAQASESIEAVGDWDALYVNSEVDKSIATMPGEASSMPFIKGLSGAAARGTYFSVIYPCTQIVFSQDCVWWLDIKPMAVDRSKLILGACFPRSSIALPDFDQRVLSYYSRWEKAIAEDNLIAEAQQRGQTSGVSQRGRFSLREHCVHKLANWVLDRVLD